MKFIDLTHWMSSEMPVYPGTSQPKIYQSASLRNEQYRETGLCIKSHTGTHIDAPAHMLEKGDYLDNFDLCQFTGKALIICIPKGIGIISKLFLSEFSNQLENVDFVLFNTGWGDYWGSVKYYENFPVLSKDATSYLTAFRMKGIGFDTISADSIDSQDYANHYLLFENGLIIIENLRFPTGFDTSLGELFCFPLKFGEADGSPVRAVLKIN